MRVCHCVTSACRAPFLVLQTSEYGAAGVDTSVRLCLYCPFNHITKQELRDFLNIKSLKPVDDIFYSSISTDEEVATTVEECAPSLACPQVPVLKVTRT